MSKTSSNTANSEKDILHRPLVLQIVLLTYTKWRDDRTMRLGAGLAYYGIFAIFPVLILMVMFAAIFFSSQQVQSYTYDLLTSLFGYSLPDVVAQVSSKIGSLSETTSISSLGIIGVASLFISASFIFLALQDALDVIWNNPAQRALRRSVKRYLIAYGVVLLSSSLLFFALIVNTASSVAKFIIPGNIALLESLADVVVFIGSWGFGIVIIALIFKALICANITWRVLLVSATITSILVVFGTWLLGLYLSTVGFTSLGGAIGSFFVLLLWIYYEAQIFLLGAQLTYVISANRVRIRKAGFKII